MLHREELVNGTPIKIEPYEIVIEHGARRRAPLWLLVVAGLAWLALSAVIALLTYRSSPKSAPGHTTVVPLPRSWERQPSLRAHR